MIFVDLSKDKKVTELEAQIIAGIVKSYFMARYALASTGDSSSDSARFSQAFKETEAFARDTFFDISIQISTA